MRGVEALNHPISFADLQRMPDDGNRYELYDGELRVVPSPILRHQIVSVRLLEALLDYRRLHGGLVIAAPFDIVLSEFNVLQPDLVYFAEASTKRLHPDEYVRFPPDLAIEVLSPSTAIHDRGRKRDLFARFALAELWIVDPWHELVEVSVLERGAYAEPRIVRSGAVESSTIPGLTLALAPLFEKL
jgi:Uma2 family endonuclease